MRVQEIVDARAEARAAVLVLGLEQQPVSDVQHLAGVVLVHQERQLVVAQVVQRGDAGRIAADVVVLAGLVEVAHGVVVQRAVERRVVAGDHAHGFQPVGAGRLEMEFALAEFADDREHRELVGSGMDGDLVAQGAGDLAVLAVVGPERVQVAAVVDALLELAAKARRQAGQLDVVGDQLGSDKIMGFRRRRCQRLIDRQLEVDRPRARFDQVMVDFGGVADGVAVNEHDAAQGVRVVVQFHVAADADLTVEPVLLQGRAFVVRDLTVALGDRLVAQVRHVVGDLFGAVERDHGHAALQGHAHFRFGLEMVAVGAETGLVAFLEDGPGGGGQHIVVVAPGQVQLADRLLGQHRENIQIPDRAQMAGGRQTEPVAQPDGHLAPLVADRPGKGEQLAQAAAVGQVGRADAGKMVADRHVFAVKAVRNRGHRVDHQDGSCRFPGHEQGHAIDALQRLRINGPARCQAGLLPQLVQGLLRHVDLCAEFFPVVHSIASSRPAAGSVSVKQSSLYS